MPLSSLLFYLLLLYAVFNKRNRLSVNTCLLIAVGIIIVGACCSNPDSPQLYGGNGRRANNTSAFIVSNGL